MTSPARFTLPSNARREPIVAVTGFAVAMAVLVPIADVPLPPIASFVAICCGIVVLADLLTFWLVVRIYLDGGSPRYLLLAMAFACSGLVVMAMVWSLPGLISAEPPLGGETGWGYFWLIRHTLPPLMIGLALAPGALRGTGAAGGRTRLSRRAGVAGALVLTAAAGPGLGVALAVLADGQLPALASSTAMTVVTPAGLVALGCCATGLALALAGCLGRGQWGVESWAVVASVAWVGDAFFTLLYDQPFTVGYYAARAFAIIASLIVAVALLRDLMAVRRTLVGDNSELEDQVERLAESERLRDHVIAVVSHDLRTPIAGLRGYLEILVEDDVDARLALQMHQRSLMLTRRLAMLTEDLLATFGTGSSIGSKLSIAPVTLDLSEQLYECASGFPGTDLRVSCPRGLPVYADPLRVQQVLANLVRNAEEHGAAPVTVTCARDGDWATITVSDAGDGVPPAFVPRLFERYTQHHPGRGGSGLGLSVVHDLVVAQGGTVRYDLTIPAFVVQLPACGPDSSPRAHGVRWSADTREVSRPAAS